MEGNSSLLFYFGQIRCNNSLENPFRHLKFWNYLRSRV